MDGYNNDDRRAAYETQSTLGTMSERIARLERGQRVSLRRIRRLPDLTASAIVQAVGKRALLLIGAGIALGAVAGGAGIELVQRMIKWAFTAG